MPCMCGDICCPSCGPAQGNSRCLVCRAWASEGCADPEDCAKKMPAVVAAKEASDDARAAAITKDQEELENFPEFQTFGDWEAWFRGR